MHKSYCLGYKNFFTLMVGVFFLIMLVTNTALAGQDSNPPVVMAKAAILVDVESGRIIWGKNINQRRHQASTTKITTGILALEKGQLDKKIKISEYAAITGESSIWLAKGETLTLHQLLQAALIQSANDACVAIAEEIGGSEAEFVKMMNDKVLEIGAKNTHYTNPHGLHNSQHYSSAYDLALIARYGLREVPGFQELVKTWRSTIPWTGHPWDRVLYNHNKLLKKYKGADGVKTGYTKEAGKCLVSSATRNGHQFIAVVLDSPDMYTDSAHLLDYGFKNFNLVTIEEGERYIKSIPVVDGESKEVEVFTKETIKYPFTIHEKKLLTNEIKLDKSIKAPFYKGTKVGEIIYRVDNKIIVREELIVKEEIKEKSFMTWLKEVLQNALKIIAVD